ncbi:MAG: MFS transporter [Desulfobacteraceae bacterium]|nr:MFS transporter [Desulfobacteraceae bacterium]
MNKKYDALPVNIYITTHENIKRLNPRIVFIFAIASGISVANLYLSQPLLDSIAKTFHCNTISSGFIVTFTQIGYVLGLMFLVPLGDIIERKHLILSVLFFLVLSLIAATFSPSIIIFILSSLAIGLTSVVAQILVPFSATLALNYERGKVVGQVMSGLLTGILLARTLSGMISSLLGWRFVFGIASIFITALFILLSINLPENKVDTRLNYVQLLRSVWEFARTEPILRKRALYGALVFADFSVLWTSLTFILSRPPYGYSDAVIGLFGLIGASGVISANIAGRMADRGYARSATGFFVSLILISFMLAAMGATSLLSLVMGIILLDFGVQGTHILNQSEIYRLRPEARSRLTTAYMMSFFIGGSIGSATSAAIFSYEGWAGVCALGAVYSVTAIIIWATDRHIYSLKPLTRV